MFENGPLSVDVWVDFESADENGHALADLDDWFNPPVPDPGTVVVASDDDYIGLAVVVGLVRQGGRKNVKLYLPPDEDDEYMTAITQAASDPCDDPT